MRMDNRQRKGIGCIRRPGWIVVLKPNPDKVGHLFFRGRPVPCQGLLHTGWGVVDQLKVTLGTEEARDPAGMCHQRGGGLVLVMGVEGLKDNRRRLIGANRLLKRLVEVQQPIR